MNLKERPLLSIQHRDAVIDCTKSKKKNQSQAQDYEEDQKTIKKLKFHSTYDESDVN